MMVLLSVIIGLVFPISNDARDGFKLIAPVKQFPPNGYGYMIWLVMYGKYVLIGLMPDIMKLLTGSAQSKIQKVLKHGRTH